MMRTRVWLWGAAAAAVLCTRPMAVAQFGEPEWEEFTPYYEDDAWYDISEWFDGNDYNPTDEQIGVINDEVYDPGVDDVDYDNDLDYDYGLGYDDDYDAYGTDDYGADTDLAYDDYDWYDSYYDDYDAYDEDWTWYGYDAYEDDDWFYDWYDDGYASWQDWDSDGVFDTKYRYFDYDDDGLYDAVLTQRDLNDDGEFEDTEYHTFSDTVTAQQRERSEQAATGESQQQQVSGSVNRVKSVLLPTGEHMVVELSARGSRINVDLGPEQRLDDMEIRRGDRLQVAGPMTKVGDKRVLMAQSVTLDGEERTINRSTRQTSGTVASTREAQIRGNTHLIALIEQDDQRIAVDLGSPGQGQRIDVRDGDEITVFGPRVKVQDRTILMAQKVEFDGRTMQVQRGNDQRSQNVADRSRDQRERDRGEARDEQRPARVSGEIVAMRKATVRGNRRQIAEVETDRGDTVVIDLGPADQFRADLQEGDQLEGRGLLTKSGDTLVLVAQQVTANDRQFAIHSGDQQQRNRREFSGEIVRLRTATVRDEQRRIATIETEDGRQLMVDLGEQEALDADLQRGDSITVTGIVVKSGDRQVVVATQLSHDGETMRVARPDLEERDQSQRNNSRRRNNALDERDSRP